MMNRVEISLDLRTINRLVRKVNVRGNLPVGSLISAIKDKYSLDDQYELHLPGVKEALLLDQTLDVAGVRGGMTLECVQLREPSQTPALIEKGTKMRFSQTYARVFFLEQSTLSEFELTWWPAIIGRRDRSDPVRNKLLAVDLEPLEKTSSVSRHHACVTEDSGSFFIEALADKNPVYLEGKRLQLGSRYALPTGMTIQVGQLKLNFNVRD